MLDMQDKAKNVSSHHVARLKSEQDTEPEECNKAAKMFRKAFNDIQMNKPLDSTSHKGSFNADSSKNCDNLSLYAAYVQAHWLMKSTNLRLDKKNEEQQMFCTQTWPRSLCNRNDINRFNSDYESHTVTCLNPAEVWCDHPSCEEARCGKQGCLRCYRFLPRDYTLSANGMIVGRQSERSYDLVSFVKCTWCCVSFCNKHFEFSSRRGHEKLYWYQCDVCQRSSCLDCVSQVFNGVPDAKGCQVVTNGIVCGRKICKDCVWYVGTLKDGITSSKVVAIQGNKMSPIEKNSLSSPEECCPTCHLQVEKRMKEMQEMQQAFMGFMP